MPPSGYELITNVLGVLSREKPASILDIGICDGKWGFLAREQLELHENERHFKEDWKVTIHGIEIFEKYRTPVWSYAYDQVFIGNALELVPTLGDYDIIIITEVIEHIEKQAGVKLLEQLMRKARKGVVISFPDGRSPHALDHGSEHDVCGNIYEKHLSLWTEEDLARWGVERLCNSCYFVSPRRDQRWPYAERSGLWQERDEPGFTANRALLTHIPGSSLRIPCASPVLEFRLMAFPWGGKARLLVNGQFERDLDLYAPERTMNVYSANVGLGGGEISLELLPQHNPRSMGTELWFDYAKERHASIETSWESLRGDVAGLKGQVRKVTHTARNMIRQVIRRPTSSA